MLWWLLESPALENSGCVWLPGTWIRTAAFFDYQDFYFEVIVWVALPSSGHLVKGLIDGVSKLSLQAVPGTPLVCQWLKDVVFILRKCHCCFQEYIIYLPLVYVLCVAFYYCISILKCLFCPVFSVLQYTNGKGKFHLNPGKVRVIIGVLSLMLVSQINTSWGQYRKRQLNNNEIRTSSVSLKQKQIQLKHNQTNEMNLKSNSLPEVWIASQFSQNQTKSWKWSTHRKMTRWLRTESDYSNENSVCIKICYCRSLGFRISH